MSSTTLQSIPAEVLLNIFEIACLDNYDHHGYPEYDEDKEHKDAHHELFQHEHFNARDPYSQIYDGEDGGSQHVHRFHYNPDRPASTPARTYDTLDLLHPLWTTSQVCHDWRKLSHESMGAFWGVVVLMPVHPSQAGDRLKRAKHRIAQSIALSADQLLHLYLRDMNIHREPKVGAWLPTVLGPEYRRISYLDARCDDKEAWFPLPLDPSDYGPQRDPHEDDNSGSDEDEDFFGSPADPVFENMQHLVLSFPTSTLMIGSFPTLRTASFDGLHPGLPFLPWDQLEVLRITNVPPSLVYPMAGMSGSARQIYIGPGPRGSEPDAPPPFYDETEIPAPSAPTHPNLKFLTLPDRKSVV